MAPCSTSDPSERTFEKLSQNEEFVISMHRLKANTNEDPLVREMALAVLRECREGRTRKIKNMLVTRFTLAFFTVVIVFLIFLLTVKMSSRD